MKKLYNPMLAVILNLSKVEGLILKKEEIILETKDFLIKSLGSMY